MSRITTPLRHASFKNLLVMLSVALLLPACGGGGGGGGGGAPPPPAPNSPWTWISGSNIVNQAGVYGTQGVAAAANVPGARESAASWIDSSNTLWLMGGLGYGNTGTSGRLNDLWKFTSATGWTWVSGSNIINQAGVYGTKGTADLANVPGARSFATTWIDSSNTLWLMGGFGYDSVGSTLDRLNDLWKFDPVTGFWTWVSGSNTVNQAGVYGAKGVAAATNVPGARVAANSWIDSSNTLWLMGGVGLDDAGALGRLNDLWKLTGGNWTWVSGSNFVNQAGTYGTKGVGAASNVPGGRSTGAFWIDSSNTLWLMGGFGLDSAGTSNRLNDLWKFDGANWTWVSGSNVVSQPGVYGTQGVAAAANVPGARSGGTSWIDSSNTLWLMGGFGLDSAGTPNLLNDLWKFDGVNWTWVYGSNTVNQSGSYGTQGVAGPGHVPGARQLAVSWVDSSNTLWLFGGSGYDSAGTSSSLSDLWRYVP